ncbi:imelysin family protein [Aliamphritea ceti]|uniref:imelysin family protein n=1 Tax=Aliamphritea ceti TaxID=1524258 RepID=UPI0021C424E8|nr:imelysin family protein [Aliamphritea ceti]
MITRAISRSLLCSALLGQALLSQTQAATAPSDTQWRSLNQTIVAKHVLPRYQNFAEATTQMAAASKALCLDATSENLSTAQQSYHQAMDAWQSIQHVRFGPIENLMRSFSVQYWPDKKNLTGKHINGLLSKQDETSLTAEFFRSASIAVKGLPAVERLLFDEAGLPVFANNSYQCRLNASISQYLADLGQHTAMEWQDYATSFDEPGNGISYYDTDIEASTDLMKAMVEPVEVIRDLKILRPLGTAKKDVNGKVKPRRSESWRSSRSLRNIENNVATLHDLYSGQGDASFKALLSTSGHKDLADSIEANFVSVEKELQTIPGPMFSTIEQPATQQQLRDLSANMKTLQYALGDAMQVLDLQLGFNSRDGD